VALISPRSIRARSNTRDVIVYQLVAAGRRQQELASGVS